MLVKEVMGWLSKRDPEEVIAFTGFWYQEDVEANNDMKFTDEQWETIVLRHEDSTDRHIDDVGWDVTH